MLKLPTPIVLCLALAVGLGVTAISTQNVIAAILAAAASLISAAILTLREDKR